MRQLMSLGGKVASQHATSIPNTFREIAGEWRSSKTLIIRKATPEELARYMEVR